MAAIAVSIAAQNRQVRRLVNEFQFRVGADLLRRFDGDLTRALVFLFILRAALHDWAADERLAEPQQTVGRTNVATLARAMDRPFETIRRHVRQLERDGLVTTRSAMLAISSDGATKQVAIDLLSALHDRFMRMVGELVAAGVPLDPTRRSRPVALAERLARIMDVVLHPLERMDREVPNWNLLLIWGAAATASLGHITRDPELALRYRFEPPPDALRRPVSLRAIAEALSMPYQTAWRHARQAESIGLMTALPEGWCVTEANSEDERLLPAQIDNAAYLLRKVRELVALGLCQDDLVALAAHRGGPARPAMTASAEDLLLLET